MVKRVAHSFSRPKGEGHSSILDTGQKGLYSAPFETSLGFPPPHKERWCCQLKCRPVNSLLSSHLSSKKGYYCTDIFVSLKGKDNMAACENNL